MKELLDEIYKEVQYRIKNEFCNNEDFKIVMKYDKFNSLIAYSHFSNMRFNKKRKGFLFGVEVLSSKDLQQDFILTDNERNF